MAGLFHDWMAGPSHGKCHPMNFGSCQKSSSAWGGVLLALVAGGAWATDAVGPADIETVLTAFTRSEFKMEFRQGVAELPGVLAIADIGRARLYMVRSRDENGAVVDQAPKEFSYLLDALVFDPATYPAFAGPAADILAQLGDGEIVLGKTSAKVRGLGPGSTLEMADGTTHTVRAIVDDGMIQNREMALAVADLAGGEGPTRGYLLVRYLGPLETVEDLFQTFLPEEASVRLRSTEPSEFLPSPAVILPQAQMKLALGEFAFRPTDGRYIERDRVWVQENLINAVIPLLGRVRCHAVLVPALQGAMQEVINADLAFLISPEAFQGCDNPRLIAEGRGFSRHAWGGAVDINYSSDATIRANGADPRLVAIMERWGFTSGHLWNNPDPGHFEYIGPPQPEG